ncbi:unnamed protein product [Natator depressus]
MHLCLLAGSVAEVPPCKQMPRRSRWLQSPASLEAPEPAAELLEEPVLCVLASRSQAGSKLKAGVLLKPLQFYKGALLLWSETVRSSANEMWKAVLCRHMPHAVPRAGIGWCSCTQMFCCDKVSALLAECVKLAAAFISFQPRFSLIPAMAKTLCPSEGRRELNKG